MIPQWRQHRPGTDQVDPYGRQLDRQAPHHAVQARRVAGHDGPVLARFPAHGAGRQGEGRRGARVEVLERVLGEQEGRVEADHGRLLDEVQRRVLELGTMWSNFGPPQRSRSPSMLASTEWEDRSQG